MPLYEYKCEKCSHEFEVIQKFSDELLKECEKCLGPVSKLMSKSSFALKGGGWYDEGYSGKSNKKESKPEPASGGGHSGGGGHSCCGSGCAGC